MPMSNSQLLISVIVPVYNVEEYICRCIDSLLAQTYPHIEVILVNDGSTDNSGKICDEYAAKDSRIKVVHQPNGGVSAARQTGIDAATGEYTIHADPDDWVEADMLQELVTKAQEENADMVICDYYTEDKDGSHYCNQNPGEDLNAKNVLKKILLQQLHGSCCNKLVSRVCYNGITFSPGHLCILEDEVFNIKVLARGRGKVCYLPKAYYHYRTTNEESLCHSMSDKSLQSKIDAIKELENHLNECDFAGGYAIKKNVLFDAFRTKRFKLLKTLYPEIHHRLITEGKSYRWYMPQTCCLSLALRGHCRRAYMVYNANMKLIKICKRIKSLLHRQIFLSLNN